MEQVSSSLYKKSNLPDRLAALPDEARVEDLCYQEDNYDKSRAYADSKLAGMLFMHQMSRRQVHAISFFHFVTATVVLNRASNNMDINLIK